MALTVYLVNAVLPDRRGTAENIVDTGTARDTDMCEYVFARIVQ